MNKFFDLLFLFYFYFCNKLLKGNLLRCFLYFFFLHAFTNLFKESKKKNTEAKWRKLKKEKIPFSKEIFKENRTSKILSSFTDDFKAKSIKEKKQHFFFCSHKIKLQFKIIKKEIHLILLNFCAFYAFFNHFPFSKQTNKLTKTQSVKIF